jgi:hypothetical protein
MATSTLVQYLESTDAAGADLGITPSYRSQFETFIATEAIALGQAVGMDLSQSTDAKRALSVRLCDGNVGDRKNFVGVATHAAAVGERVKVCLSGFCEAKIENGVTQGAPLTLSVNVGNLDGYQAADVLAVAGYCVDANSSGSAAIRTVILIKQF